MSENKKESCQCSCTCNTTGLADALKALAQYLEKKDKK